MSHPISIPAASLLALNVVLPTSFRTPFPDASGDHVLQIAATVITSARIANGNQAREIDGLKREIDGLKKQVEKLKGEVGRGVKKVEEARMKIDSSLLLTKIESQSLSVETLLTERADYHYNTMRLIMYITGEGAESWGPTIDYSKLRQVLEAAREGGWNIKKVAEGIEEVLPADKEIIKKRKEMWEWIDRGRGQIVRGREQR
jgi:hypothetical protein